MHISDAIHAATGEISNPDGQLAFYQANGAVSNVLLTAEHEYLIAAGATSPNLPDAWDEFLTTLFGPGTLSDRKLLFWLDKIITSHALTIGQDANLYGYYSPNHPSGPMGSMVPSDVAGVIIYQYTVNSSNNGVNLQFGEESGENLGVNELDVWMDGFTGTNPFRVVWSQQNGRYQATNVGGLGAFMVTNNGQTVNMTIDLVVPMI